MKEVNNLDNNDKLEILKDFLVEKNLLRKFKKWVETLGLEDDEEFDLKEWAS